MDKNETTWYLGYYLAFVIFVISLFRLEVRRKNQRRIFLWLTIW